MYPEDEAKAFLLDVCNVVPECDVTSHMTTAQILIAMKTLCLILNSYFAACTDSDAADNYCLHIHCHRLQLL
jgi:hypothetical protein